MRIPGLILCVLLPALVACAADAFPRGADACMPDGARRIVDIPYGADAAQRFDVYLPAEVAPNAPILLMVHGGGWRRGDKQTREVVGAKADWWLAKGHVLVSANYRMRPAADPVEQARDVARALRLVQQLAPSWNADPAKVVLMGHSAGGHLVALLAASPRLAEEVGAAPFPGAVALDSGAMDVVGIMEAPHFRLFDDAFGAERALWHAASPLAQLSPQSRPMLVVCSTRRSGACADAARIAEGASMAKAQVEVVRVDKSHRAANADVGVDSGYTRRIDAFIRRLLVDVRQP